MEVHSPQHFCVVAIKKGAFRSSTLLTYLMLFSFVCLPPLDLLANKLILIKFGMWNLFFSKSDMNLFEIVGSGDITPPRYCLKYFGLK